MEPSRYKSSKHRVIAICDCGKHVPVGRLHQHVCKCLYCGDRLGTQEEIDKAMQKMVQNSDGTWRCPKAPEPKEGE